MKKLLGVLWDLFKGVVYVAALFYLLGGGVCALVSVWHFGDGGGYMLLIGLAVMGVSYGVMRWTGVGRKKADALRTDQIQGVAGDKPGTRADVNKTAS